jgi:kanamycin kinase
LAVASWSVDYNFGPGWEDEFFKVYGIERDEKRTSFYRVLWENEGTIDMKKAK